MYFCSIKGHQEFVYNGDRSKEELLPYAIRMSGPPVQQVTRVDSFDMLKVQNEIFFTYVGLQTGALWDTYHTTAEHFQPHGFFYATNSDIANHHFQIDTLPAVLVYKEKSHFYFPRNFWFLCDLRIIFYCFFFSLVCSFQRF